MNESKVYCVRVKDEELINFLEAKQKNNFKSISEVIKEMIVKEYKKEYKYERQNGKKN